VAERRFLVEGPQAVREALGLLVELFTSDPDDPLVREAAARGVEVVHVDDKALAAVAETVTPQGVVGVAPLLEPDLAEALSGARLVAVLHEKAGKRHLLERKASKITRRLTGTAELSPGDAKTAKKLLGL
jgi:ribosomal protein L35